MTYIGMPQTRILYTFAVIIVSLVALGFLYFILYAAITPIHAAIVEHMANLPESDASPTFDLADTFMMNLWGFLLVITCLGLLYWVYIYSQRKGTPVMYE